MINKQLIIFIVLITLSMIVAGAEKPDRWMPLADDGLHDPESPAVQMQILQEPAAALSTLPGDVVGNKVLWVDALRDAHIEPRTNLYEHTEVKVLDLDIILERTGEMPMVRFPHKAHTEWLDCDNCHDEIFKPKVGANDINMMAILTGEYCGRCHGAVAFPLTECLRCHSVARNLFKGKPGAQPTAPVAGLSDE